MYLKLTLCPVFLGLLFAVPAAPVFSEPVSLAEVYEAIDEAFTKKSDEQLIAVLGDNRQAANYPLYENYVMKKIRLMVIKEDFLFARDACLVVIDNNMDNDAALELYSVIDDGITRQETEARRREEEAMVKKALAEQERRTVLASVGDEYRTVKTSSGESVYLQGADEQYSRLALRGVFGMADTGPVTVSSENYTSLRYGIAVYGSAVYLAETLGIGCDLSAEVLPLAISQSDGTMLSTLRVIPKLSVNRLSRRLFFRTGFAAMLTSDGSDADKVRKVHKTFMSPVLGVGLEHIQAGPLEFKLFGDYYPAHFAESTMKFAMESGAFLTLPLVNMDQARIGLDIGLCDTLYMLDGGMENRLRMIVGFGVGNVTK